MLATADRAEVAAYEQKRAQLMSEYSEIHEGSDYLSQSEKLYSVGKIDIEIGNINKLEETLDLLSELSRVSKDIRIQAQLIELESEFFRLKGLYRHSLQSYKKYVGLQDSIAKLKQDEAINELKENHKKEVLAQNENRKAERWNYIYISLAIFLIALLLLFYGIFKRRKVVGLYSKIAKLMSEYVKSYSSKLSDPSYGKSVIEEVHLDKEWNVDGLTDEIVLKILEGLKKFEEQEGFLNENTSINDVADFIHTNKTYLSKVLNVVKKKPFTIYLNELRIVHAVKLLQSQQYKKYTIKAISREAGFKSKSTFNLAFKEYVGMTPSEFIRSVEAA